MKTAHVVTLFAALFSVVFWVGCDDEDKPEPRPHGLPTVQIVPEIHNDTLRFFTEDSVYFAITIIVISSQGLAYPDQKVDISLSDSSLGVLNMSTRFCGTLQTLGRVNCRFYAYAQSGEQTITASAGGLVDTLVFTMMEVARPLSGFTLTSDRPHDTIYVAPDSELVIHVTAFFANGNGNPRTEFDGMFISSSASGGTLERFTMFSNGLSTCTWAFQNQYGTFQARIFGNWLDPLTIAIDSSAFMPPFELTLQAVPEILVACSSHTVSSYIEIRLHDGNNHSFPYDTVQVSMSGGYDYSHYVPLHNGVGAYQWVFRDEFGTFQFVATYQRWGLRDSIAVEVALCDSLADN